MGLFSCLGGSPSHPASDARALSKRAASSRISSAGKGLLEISQKGAPSGTLGIYGIHRHDKGIMWVLVVRDSIGMILRRGSVPPPILPPSRVPFNSGYLMITRTN